MPKEPEDSDRPEGDDPAEVAARVMRQAIGEGASESPAPPPEESEPPPGDLIALPGQGVRRVRRRRPRP